ncbi:MAG: hypothetical protein ACOZCO_15365 [Bacteroidota bacterium]
MKKELSDLIYMLNDPRLSKADVIMWGSPIISFGNVSNSKIATLGLNPSNREFVDVNGKELEGNKRRFHTLQSLGIKKWSEISEKHLNKIKEFCEEYFLRNPYDEWFKKLDYIISGTSMSYYFPSGEACHLDLIPYATASKWTELSYSQKRILLDLTIEVLGKLIKNSEITILILNGQTVVDNLEKVAGIKLKKSLMKSWTLPRKDTMGVQGFSYTGTINNIGGINFKREVSVLGFNHNIQSSYGVTSEVHLSIRKWVTNKAKEILE